MYAVIKSGGKQFKVSVGDVIYVEKLSMEDGAAVDFDVLVYANEEDIRIGTPVVEQAKVQGKVVRQVKGTKVYSLRYKAKKHSRTKRGHRQPYTQVEITAIEA
ncbi:MAG: 50S ribosomal protein L21 [Eubacteriales bacterium]|nr:50S ribosomal protein L21 [Eubacteriales bacterium]